MTAFNYLAINSEGKKQKGFIEADNTKQARQLLKQANLMLLEIYATEEKHYLKTNPSKKQYLNTKELALVTRQLATLISAGLPLEDVLAAVAEQTEQPRTKGLILAVKTRITEGRSFASALREYPHAFSNLYCSTIEAGEKSGHLDKILLRLADYIENQFETRQKIMHALIYPTIMMLVAISIVGFLLEYVVPKMISVYSNLGQTLPLMTTLLIGLSTGLHHYGIYLVLAMTVCLFLFYRSLKNNDSFREKTHLFLLRLPVIGNAIKIINTARFARTFAILFSAGVTVIEAMTISAKLITHIPIRKAIEGATDRVREGANIHLALKQTRYFPPMSIHLIASGESSGQLENMLERAANNQDADIHRLIATSLSLFEPIIILIMGGIVLFIVLAVLLPIFQLNQFMG